MTLKSHLKLSQIRKHRHTHKIHGLSQFVLHTSVLPCTSNGTSHILVYFVRKIIKGTPLKPLINAVKSILFLSYVALKFYNEKEETWRNIFLTNTLESASLLFYVFSMAFRENECKIFYLYQFNLVFSLYSMLKFKVNRFYTILFECICIHSVFSLFPF